MLSKLKKHVMLGSLLVLLMITCRVLYSGKATYTFILWNMFLAYLPLLVAQLSRRQSFHSWKLLLASVVWLLFFPNAPYLITDLYHLSNLDGAPLWYDALMLFTAAYTCIAMGFVSLRLMEMQWEQFWQSKWLAKWMGHKMYMRWILMILLFTATGFGIYLGRVLRYNSWDIVTDTNHLAIDIASRVLQPAKHFQTWGFTFAYATCLFFFYYAWIGKPFISKKRWSG